MLRSMLGDAVRQRMIPFNPSGKRKVDLDSTTLGSLMAHKLAQDAERETAGVAWTNGTLPDEHGRPVKLSGLMFTRPDGRYLDPQWVTRRMQQIARRASLCTTVRQAAEAGALELVVGVRYRAPVGTWTLYVDREPVGEVTVTDAANMSGTRAPLTLAEPLPLAVGVGAELGRSLPSRRRLHDLRHSSASIQLDEGIDIALVSKRLGHSSPAITGNLYVHLLRSSGQKAAETVAAAVPRSTRRGHPAGTGAVGDASHEVSDSGSPSQKAVRTGKATKIIAEDARFEPEQGRSARITLVAETGAAGRVQCVGWSRHMAQRVGIHLIYHFLDLDLAALVWSLPPQLLRDRGREKAVLRDALADLLPPSVYQRTAKAEALALPGIRKT